MTTKRSKAKKLKEMQERRDLALALNGERSVVNGDIPVQVIWRYRAHRLEGNRKG